MKKIITPAEAGRELEYDRWAKGVMPMMHVTVTLDFTHLIRYCKKHKEIPVHAATCYCIGRAADKIRECHLLVTDDGFVWSDIINTQTVIKDKKGDLRYVEFAPKETLSEYAVQYRQVIKEAREKCEHHFLGDGICIGTSCASTRLVIDSCANQYTGDFNNLFLMWGAFRRTFFRRYKLAMTVQFHHVQINGGEICLLFENIQDEINSL